MAKVYVYGMLVQSFAPGAQPEDGWLDVEIDPLDEYKNVVVYSRELSREECERFGLDFLGVRETQ